LVSYLFPAVIRIVLQCLLLLKPNKESTSFTRGVIRTILLQVFEAVDIYCERLGPEFWAEPANALTNAFFLVVAWLTWRRAKALDTVSPAVWALVVLLSAIGIGSFLFHTFANGWSRFADVAPIILFQVLTIWLYLTEVAGMKKPTATFVMVVFATAVMIAREFPEYLNRSLPYLPAFLAMVAISIFHKATDRREPYVMLAATGTLFVALFFRTIDHHICPCIELGSHFLWHTFAAVTFYLSMRGFLANRPGV
jgi:hypothetical protein